LRLSECSFRGEGGIYGPQIAMKPAIPPAVVAFTAFIAPCSSVTRACNPEKLIPLAQLASQTG